LSSNRYYVIRMKGKNQGYVLFIGNSFWSI
jgi:hypothetical protein